MLKTGMTIDFLKQRLQNLEHDFQWDEFGIVLSINEFVVSISGLNNIQMSEKVTFASGAYGIIVGFDENYVAAIVLGNSCNIKEGEEVRRTREKLQTPVGPALIGRIVNALGEPIDDLGDIQTDYYSPIECKACGIMTRKSICKPLLTGTSAIDAIIPIGKGQRELVIGDSKTGKTMICLNAIENQMQFYDNEAERVYCIYVAIGQETSNIAKIIKRLQTSGAMRYTTVVISSSADSAALQFIAPYTGCAIGEAIRDDGKNALIIYDDLTKHAAAYRAFALLCLIPPGREAYPSDIFYLHAKLLERAAQLNDKCGGGSLTAIPVIETQGGDISGYIPTNVISITDGQICLDKALFYRGVRPAVNTALSVSRVGSAAQSEVMKPIAGKAKAILAQYGEMAHFSRISSTIDDATRNILIVGEILVELLKQNHNKPIIFEEQIVILFAGVDGLLNNIEPKYIHDCMQLVLQQIHEDQQTNIISLIHSATALTAQLTDILRKSLAKFIELSYQTIKTR